VKSYVNRVVKPLPDNLPEWLPLRSVAELFGMSESHGHKLFRLGKLYGARKIFGRWYMSAKAVKMYHSHPEKLTLPKTRPQGEEAG
jgi:hypothetical protein